MKLLSRLEQWSDMQNIGDIFNIFTPFLKMYRQYTERYEDSLNLLLDLGKKESNLTLFTEELSTHPAAKGKQLTSYLILPVQRIPRYVLLLEDLMKNTDPNHPDYQNLHTSLTEIKAVTFFINGAVQIAENRKKMFSVQEIFYSCPIPIFQMHRTFIHDGPLLKQNRRGDNIKKNFFLFSDIIVYGREDPKLTQIRRRDTLKFGKSFYLHTINVTDLPDIERDPDGINAEIYRPNFGMVIEGPTKSFSVFASTEKEKSIWIQFLHESISTARKKEGKDSEHFEKAATWVPDFVMKKCPGCMREFGFFVRRHHCRKCGTLICDSCSRQRLTISSISAEELQRVCDSCFKSSSK